MKKFFTKILLSIFMVIPCLLSLTACNGLDNEVVSFSVELNNSAYVMENNTITVEYGSVVDLDGSDFVVTALFADNTTKVISLNSSYTQGYMFISNLPANIVTPVGEYSLTFMYEEADNVVITVKVVRAAVNMDDVDWDYESAFTYDGEEKEVKITNLPAGVSVSYVGTTKATNAGEYTVTAKFSYEDSSNYAAIEDKTLNWKIEKAQITVSNVELNNFYYDETEKTTSVKSFNLPDNVSLIGLAGQTAATNVGVYEVIVSFEHTDKDNYVVNDAKVNWEILPGAYKNVGTLSLAQDYDFTYNGLEREVYLDETNLNPNVRIKQIFGNRQTNVGVYDVLVELEYVGNNLNYNSASSITLENVWEIKKATLVLKAKDKAITYGDEKSNNGYEIIGLVNNEQAANVIAGTPVYSYGDFDAREGVVGTYDILVDVSNLTADNYIITASQEKGVLTVNKATVGALDNVELKVSELTYNGLEQTIAETLSDFVSVPSGVKIASMSENTAKNVMKEVGVFEYTLSVTFVQDDSGNYNDFEVTKTYNWKINPKTLTITINNYEITYGDEPANNGYTVNEEDLQGEDTVAVVLGTPTYSYGGYVANSDVGDYVITIGETDLYAENYKINVVNGTLTVAKKKVNISAGAWSAESDLVYNGEEKLFGLSGMPIGAYPVLNYTQDGVDVKPINAGDYVVSAVVHPLNNNFEIEGVLSESEKAFTIQQATIVVSELILEDVSNIIYSGEVYKPELANIPENVSVTYTYTQNSEEVDPINAGDYVVNISLVSLDNNYKLDVQTLTRNFTVKQKQINLSEFTWQYKNKFEYVGNNVGPILIDLPDYVNVTYNYQEDQTKAFTNAGDYTASVSTIELTDSNYVAVGEVVKNEYSIVKKEIDRFEFEQPYISFVQSLYSDLYYRAEVVYDEEGYQPSLVDNGLFDVKHRADVTSDYILDGIPCVYGVSGEVYCDDISLKVSLTEAASKNYYFTNDYDCLYVSISFKISQENPFKSLKLNGEDYNFNELISSNNKNLVYGDKITFELNEGFVVTNGKDEEVSEIVVTGNYESYKVGDYEFDVYSSSFLRYVGVDGEKFEYPCDNIVVELTEDQDLFYLELPVDPNYVTLSKDASSGMAYVTIQGGYEYTTWCKILFSAEETETIYIRYETENYADSLTIKVEKFSPIQAVEFSIYDIVYDQEGVSTYSISNSSVSFTNQIITGLNVIDINGDLLLTKVYADKDLTKELTSFEDCSDKTVYIVAYQDSENVLDVISFEIAYGFSFTFNDAGYDIQYRDDVPFNVKNVDSIKFDSRNNTSLTLDGNNAYEDVALNNIVNTMTLRYSVNYNEQTFVFEKDITFIKSDFANNYSEGSAILTYGDSTQYCVDDKLYLAGVDEFKALVSQIDNYEFNVNSLYEVLSKEIVKLNDDNWYLKLVFTNVESAGDEQTEYYVYVRIQFSGSYDNNTNADIQILNLVNSEETDAVIENESFTISNPGIECLEIYLENSDATVVLKNQSGTVLSTFENSTMYFFNESGTFTLTITATDGTERTLIITVNEILPLFEFTIDAEDDITVKQGFDEEGDLEGDFAISGDGTYFTVYLADLVGVTLDKITINSLRSALLTNGQVKLYASIENGVLSNEIDVNNAFELTLDKTLDKPEAYLYTNVSIDGEPTVVTIAFVISEGALAISVSHGETNLNSYMNAANQEFTGDFGVDYEDFLFMGFLGLEDYTSDTIVLDSISLPFIEMIEEERFWVVDYVSYLKAYEKDDESLINFIDVDSSYSASNVELMVMDMDGVTYCGLLVVYGEHAVNILLFTDDESIDLFTVSANDKEYNVDKEFKYELNDFVLTGIPYQLFIDEDYNIIFNMYGYIGEVSSENIETTNDGSYLLNVSFDGEFNIYDANNDLSEITDLSNFKLNIATDSDSGRQYVCILVEDGGYLYLYFEDQSYPVNIELGENNFDWNFEYSDEKGLLYDFGDFELDYGYLDEYDYSFTYVYIDADSIEYDEEYLAQGYKVVNANITLDKVYQDYSYIVMATGAYEAWVLGEATLGELLSDGMAFRVTDSNDLTVEVPICFTEGIGYIDIAVKGFDGVNDGELDLIRAYFIINGEGDKDSIEYGFDSEEGGGLVSNTPDLTNEQFSFTLSDGVNTDEVTSTFVLHDLNYEALIVSCDLNLSDITRDENGYITFDSYSYSGEYILMTVDAEGNSVLFTNDYKKAMICNYDDYGSAAEISVYDGSNYVYRILIVFVDSLSNN